MLSGGCRATEAFVITDSPGILRKVPHGLDALFPILDLLRPHFNEYLTRFVAFGDSMGEATDLLRLKQCRLPGTVLKALESGRAPDIVNDVISHINSSKLSVAIPQQETDHLYSTMSAMLGTTRAPPSACSQK